MFSCINLERVLSSATFCVVFLRLALFIRSFVTYCRHTQKNTTHGEKNYGKIKNCDCIIPWNINCNNGFLFICCIHNQYTKAKGFMTSDQLITHLNGSKTIVMWNRVEEIEIPLRDSWRFKLFISSIDRIIACA